MPCCPGRLDPVFETQIRDTAEVLRIVCNYGQTMSACRRRDEQIEVFDQLASSSQVRFYVTEGAGGCWIEPQHGDAAQEVVDGSMVGLWSSRPGGPVTQLRQRDDRDTHRFRTYAGETVANGRATPQPEDARIGVQQEIYRVGGSTRDRRAS